MRASNYIVTTLMTVAILLSMPGCKREPHQSQQGPDPLAAESAKAQVAALFEGTGLDAQSPPEAWDLPRADGPAFVDRVRAFVRTHAYGESADDYTYEARRAVGSSLRTMWEAQKWYAVMALYDAYGLLEPGSIRYRWAALDAEARLLKPEIELRMIFIEFATGRVTAILDFFIPLTQQRHRERLFFGEEKHGVCWIGIARGNIGVQLEYLATGERWYEYWDRHAPAESPAPTTPAPDTPPQPAGVELEQLRSTLSP